MRWKKDPFFDSIDILSKPRELRPLCSLKNIIFKQPDKCIPISALSKRGRELEISGRVASFLRRYPAVFEEFRGPKHNLPWFRLTQELMDVDQEEFSLFPSRGLRLKKKIESWLDDFQRLPYVSPYEDFSNLDPNSDVSEKRVAGVYLLIIQRREGDFFVSGSTWDYRKSFTKCLTHILMCSTFFSRARVASWFSKRLIMDARPLQLKLILCWR
ncbi:hypothetical protein KSP39_PZI017080 [Platanthera zijinensis]|uniref:PORR domain-containing protein n=1 Tax=Platanthera zijinensis TaxID=2320716 RepID=A0AAP0B7P9_9ASPA